ncbi:LacI family DNA-binding transcriptional regulator [Pedobacter rhodius]|uniref:LacI family DNA-binding transcriptional regulator n=1 Tax=Pedobacter rhodius TaxID=3004098 RepID=A0ABT4KX17_9SPHI|nr:LacI family DNA-binding transcriptional regulator [Pedobacter sp. SJ11]MCZ4223473.1 LacI family DNA-binding transcriptional regulator [Pedobacter sp. SJ11]
MAKKLSIRDIANELNISKTTISFILNGKAREKRISDVLTEKVLKYVAEKGYKPNQLAKSLSTGKTMIIGLMVEKISDYFFAQMAYHVEELAYDSGYKILYCSTDNDLLKTRELISLFRDRHVDGYIITPPAGLEKDVQALIDDGLPVVLFDRYFEDVDSSYVVLDNYKASYDAVKYLTQKQFKNIGFIELDSDQSQMKDRRNGYLKALQESDLVPMVLRVPFSNSPDKTMKHLIDFIEQNKNMDALFFATNYLAFEGVKALGKLKFKIPQDMAVIAFDDHQAFDIYTPTITAVAQPIDELAKKSIHTLLNMLNSQSTVYKQEKVIVPANLIIRDSTEKNNL